MPKLSFKVSFAGTATSGALVLAISLFTVILVNIGVSNLRIDGEPLPEYGTWTGIVPFEQKLRLLREFANEGPVDAMILGASIADHGISAAVLSQDLTVAYGKSFRVFNFSSGAAELPTLTLLYRLARTVAKPKQIWIAHPVEQNVGDEIRERSPDYALLHSPVATGLRYPFLLPLSFRVFQLPVVHYARALRDLAMYGKFANRPSGHSDVYDNNPFGDTRGFLYYSGAVPISKYAEDRRGLVLSLAKQYANAPDERTKIETYFSRGSLDAIAELRALAARDHCSVTLLAHDTVAGYSTLDSEYQAASDIFYKLLSQYFAAPVIDARAWFHLTGYKFADPIHLNSNGADELSSDIAAKIAGRAQPIFSDVAVAPEVLEGSRYPDVTPYTAVVIQKHSDPRQELQLRYLQGAGVAPLRANTRIRLVALLPDRSTVAVPARVVSRGQVFADTSALPSEAAGQVLLLQLTDVRGKWGSGLNLPLASYRWSASTVSQQSPIEIFADATSYPPGVLVNGVWKNLDPASKDDWVGLFPEGGSDESRLDFKFTGGKSEGELDLTIPNNVPEGNYELRLYAAGGWFLIAKSPSFKVVAPARRSNLDPSKDRIRASRGLYNG